MDEEDIIKLEDVEIKYEPLSSDDEYDFQFEVEDQEYDEVLKELKAKDSDLEEIENEIKISCPHGGCKKAFSRNHNLIKHLKCHELGLDRPGSICHICGKTIKGVYSLHLKIHQNIKQFNCEDCGRFFRQKIALTNHLLIHKNEKPHECPWCFKRFRQKYTMQHHCKNRHTGVKDHICELCGKEFSDRATLQKHTLVHSTTKPHQCATCFMSFRHKSSLSRHNKIHMKVTECMHCNRSFRYESFLKKHLLTAHKGQQIVYIDQVIPKDEIKQDDCSIVVFESNETTQVSPMEVTTPTRYYSQPISSVHQTYSS